ncbi:MAG: CsgG/HfaB family protein [Treponemataceae bacterium]|nr:CsgG/HfaB family protein [Treponemataceae bacterium]
MKKLLNLFILVFCIFCVSCISLGQNQEVPSTPETPVPETITDELFGMANKLVAETARNGKPIYAFLSFTTDYNNTLVENYVTDALTEAMFNTGKVRIIERANVETILAEQRFQASGLVSEETAKSIGKITGVDFVCYGTLKDLGETITVNARVVEVQTGELCAMARTTITKDDYLKKQKQTIVDTSSIATTITEPESTVSVQPQTTTPTQSQTPTNDVNNLWEVISYRNDFDEFTQYIFRLYTTDDKFIFVSYKKCDSKAYSKVIAGISWYEFIGHHGTYDIKEQNGTTSTKYLDKEGKMYLSQATNDYCYFAYTPSIGARWLIDILLNNDTITIRRNDFARKFQTAGLLDKIKEYGITWEELDEAMANEEF